MPGPAAARLLALQYQLEQSEWEAPGRLLDRQMHAAGALLAHARDAVPFYRERLAGLATNRTGHVDPRAWSQLPLLERADVRAAGAALHAAQVPEGHGALWTALTSGSTARPIEIVGTALTRFLGQAFALRDHLWHRRDFGGKMAVIRAEGSDRLPPGGLVADRWSDALDGLFGTGPAALLGIQTDVARQAEWLEAQDPDYLLTFPSNLMALARHFRDSGRRLPRLREVRTVSETVSEELRSECREFFGVGLTDLYSAQETGYMALQCPDHEHYHVQSENVLLEVLHGDGRPCAPGEIGRVVVTPLHNYAMPFIRYAIGDYAEVGGSCPCGRGLPVIARFMGRSRNMLVLPDGRRFWPTFPAKAWLHIGAIRQMQLVQRSLDRIEARLVADRPFTAAEQAEFERVLQGRFGHPFEIAVTYVTEIGRGPGLKFEDFVSEVAAR